jgi:hypothetical protein
MTISVDDARFFLFSEKRLLDIKGWAVKRTRDQRDELLEFLSRVSIESALPRGLWFRACIITRFQDSASIQLKIEKPGERTRLPLYRLDWRPPSRHGNGMSGPQDIRGLVFDPGQTHEHICLDNADEFNGIVLSRGVQSARKIDPDFENYSEAFTYVCDKLRFLNGPSVPPPDAQWSLL